MKLDRIDFLIIGATKSATTWLQRSLQSDPAVFMPDPELHFFSRNYELGEDWYRDQFAGVSNSHKLVGEKSNSYLEERSAAARIRAALPNVKLIAQLRNPVDRAYSDYCMLFRRGDLGRDINRYLDPQNGSENRFLAGGLYARQMERFAERFDPSQILIVFYEGVLSEPETHLGTVRQFLGLEAHSMPVLAQKVKDKSAAIVNPRLRRYLRILKPAVAPFRKTSAFKSLHSMVARRPDYPPLSDQLRQRLVEFYSPDVECLGALTHRDLLPWLRKSGENRVLS